MVRLGKTIKAGRPGTKKWVNKYGEKLICVRYKYDFERKMKIKTVELIVEEKPWNPDKHIVPANKKVGIKVLYGEINIGKLVKAAGGYWNRKRKIWELPYKEAIALGLEERIVL